MSIKNSRVISLLVIFKNVSGSSEIKKIPILRSTDSIDLKNALLKMTKLQVFKVPAECQ